MSFQWGEYIRLAKTLQKEAGRIAGREACLRSAISRAYYGAFGLAKEIAAREGLELTGGPKDHENVQKHFLRSKNQRRKGIGLHLDRLRRKRNDADYETRFEGLEKQCVASLEQARHVAEALRQFSDDI